VAIASQEDEVAVEAPKDLDVESKTGGGAIHGAGFAQMIGAQDSEAVEVADSPEEDLGPVRPDFMRMVVDGVPMSDGGPITRVVPASKVDAPPRRAGGRPKAVDNEQLVAPPGAPVPVGGEAGPAMVPASARPRPNSPAETGRSSGTPRSVKVQLTRVSPWSVMKLAFLLSVGLGIALVVAVFVVWNVLDRSHLFIEVNDQIANIVGQESAADFDILQYVERGKVMAAATGVAVIDVVAITILATLGSLIYNITAALVGGIHVTLRND
jgi:hypothetical protein